MQALELHGSGDPDHDDALHGPLKLSLKEQGHVINDQGDALLLEGLNLSPRLGGDSGRSDRTKCLKLLRISENPCAENRSVDGAVGPEHAGEGVGDLLGEGTWPIVGGGDELVIDRVGAENRGSEGEQALAYGAFSARDPTGEANGSNGHGERTIREGGGRKAGAGGINQQLPEMLLDSGLTRVGSAINEACVAQSNSNRPQRVAQLIQQELGNLFIEGLKDPRIGFVTITEVRVTGDLRQARVFVSVYGSDEERAQSVDGLTAAAGYLKRQLAQALRLRFMPDLAFELDTSLDHVQRLDQIIQAIETGESEIPESQVAETVPVATDRTARNERAQQMNEDHAERVAKKAAKQGGRRKRRTSKR